MESVKMLLMTIAVAWLAVTAHASEPLLRVDAAGVLEASIAYHDPGGVWNTARVQLGVHTAYSEAFAAKRKRPLDAELGLVLPPAHA
jgi:hypothetical protein